MMAFMHDRIGFKWREGTRYWQIFGLLPDHRIYGEYIDEGNREGFKNLDGAVSLADYQRIMFLAEKIKGLPPHVESLIQRDFSGLLFEGQRGVGRILFLRYENAPAPIHDEFFDEIIKIIRKYCPPAIEG